MNKDTPLVSVVTPVYNGQAYLAECIDSVLGQQYDNWEYLIVNNCSVDATLDIATRYAETDKRIRVYNFEEFVGVIANHNRALRLISPDSKYCKIVSADDLLFPECLSRMVAIAEAHPSVAIVGSYAINRDGINYVGLPPERSIFGGFEVCRFHLLGGPLVMGVPSAVLYRSEIVRSQERFFPGSALSSDIAACYRWLEHHDFAFVHQILSFQRIHSEAISDRQVRLKAFDLDRIAFLSEYGRIFLTSEEIKTRFTELLDYYYCRILVPAMFGRYSEECWKYHKERLEEMGVPLDRIRLLKAVASKIIHLLCNPKQTVEKIFKRRSVFEERSDRAVSFAATSAVTRIR